MREIKFRAFDKNFTENESAMFYQVSSRTFHMRGDKDLKSCGGERPQGCLSHMITTKMIVMQYTLLNDIYNNEIYEDDILESEAGNIYLVDFRDSSYVIVHTPSCRAEAEGECEKDVLNKFCINLLKLARIGNLHENKNLLKDNK